MSSDFDERAIDNNRQTVESIEQIDDFQKEDIDSSEDEPRPIGGPISQRGIISRQEPVSETGSAARSDDRDSPEATGAQVGLLPTRLGDDVDSMVVIASLNEAIGSRTGRGQRMNAGSDKQLASEDEDQLSQKQLPPSYQIPSVLDSELSSHDTDSSDSSDSQVSQVKDGPLLTNVARNDKPRKRKLSTYGPEHQALDGPADFRPTKKPTPSLYRAYLDVLNQDIERVASQGRPTDRERMDGRVALPSSQIGMIAWTSSEKEQFFEALGRLGQDNACGIAERIHTKGEMEVRQYMKLLQDALTHRRQQNELDPIGLEEFPSAVELSHECCQALEQVADTIAMRQERSETSAEEHEHGPNRLLSKQDCKGLEDEAEDNISKPAGIFRTKEWLSLSERFFMNAPTSEGNWQSVEGETPAVRLTAMKELYSLALTLTRRLVAASHYMATTRIRAERGYRHVRESVKEKDVHAAILSLGLRTQKPPLTGCVRRLGLSVYENPPKPDEASELEPMSVTDIEDAFDIDGLRDVSHISQQTERKVVAMESSISSESSGETDLEPEEEHDGRSPSYDVDVEEEEEIELEANEAILYSAVDPPQTKRDRQALHRRIKAERDQERYADAVDANRSYQEELQMWKLLGQQPPRDLIDPGPPPPGRRVNLSVDAGYSVGKDWRAKTKAMSEWEAQYLGII